MRIILIFNLLFVAQLIIAQTPVINWGNEIDNEASTDFRYFLGKDATAIYCIRSLFAKDDKRFILSKYDTDSLTLLVKRDIINDFKEKDYSIRSTFHLNNQLYALYRDGSTSTKTSTLLLAEYSKLNLQPTGKLIEIAEFSDKAELLLDYAIYLSPDSSKILFAGLMGNINSSYTWSTKTNDLIFIAVCDVKDDYKVIVKKQIEPGTVSGGFYADNFMVDNDGNVQYTLRRAEKAKSKEGYMYSHSLFTLATNGVLSEQQIQFKSEYIREVFLDTLDGENIGLAGFYFTDQHFNETAGIVVQVLSKSDRKIKASTALPFTEEMKELYETPSGKNAMKGEKDMDRFVVNDMIKRSDGKITVICPKNYKLYPSYGDRVTTIHHYDDLMLLNFDENLNFAWHCRIPKNAEYGDAAFLSGVPKNLLLHKHILIGDKMYFLYYDNPQNLEKEMKRPIKVVPSINSSNVLVLALVNESGELTRTPIYKLLDVGFRAYSGTALVDGNLVYFYAHGKDTYKLAKMVIE